jgi:hypothetical protein
MTGYFRFAPRDPDSEMSDRALALIFMARALQPVAVNKLEHGNDWNNDTYDVRHLTDYIGEKRGGARQWRRIKLVDDLKEFQRAPVLFISGHRALDLVDADKAKLREYVKAGGTIFAMACCAKPEFDKSFRALVSELWPDGKLAPLPKSHRIYTTPERCSGKYPLEALALKDGKDRLGVIYCPKDMCCEWEEGSGGDKEAFSVGLNVYSCVIDDGPALGGIPESPGPGAAAAK